MTSDFEKQLRNHIEKTYEWDGKTIGEDITIQEIIKAVMKGAFTAGRSSKTFKNAMKKFS